MVKLLAIRWFSFSFSNYWQESVGMGPGRGLPHRRFCSWADTRLVIRRDSAAIRCGTKDSDDRRNCPLVPS